MNSRSFPSSGSFDPDDLALLKRVFTRFCENRGLDRASLASSDAGSRLIHVYQRGMRDEESLLRMLDATGPDEDDASPSRLVR